MKTPEEIIDGMEHCYGQHSCDGCPYEEDGCIPALWNDGFARLRQLEKMVADAEAAIEERDTIINLMKIQIAGDCGCCKHKDVPSVCADCMKKTGRPCWEYEGLPELPKKGES